MICTCILIALASGHVWAEPARELMLPTGGRIIEGSGSIMPGSSNSNVVNITSSSERLLIEWMSYSLSYGAAVNYSLPSADSIALNRVIGDTPSVISGTINVPQGAWWLVNPNGITFTSTAQINAGSVLASTLNITNGDFLNGSYIFAHDHAGAAFIINEGNININKPGGYVMLLSHAIDNRGVIAAHLGTIALSSGDKMTLALDDKDRIGVVIDEPVKKEVFGPDGARFDSAIKNSGIIEAGGGRVILTARMLNKIFDYAINNTGIIEAKSLADHNGIIELAAGGASLINTGTLGAGGVNKLYDNPDPIVYTDKADYSQDDSPVITGLGFTPNSAVDVVIYAPDGASVKTAVAADSEGRFAYLYRPPSLMKGPYSIVCTNGYLSIFGKFTDATSSKITTASVTTIGPAWNRQGALKMALFEFTVSSSRSDEELEDVDVTYTGTDKTDISTMYLYRESNTSGGTFDPSADVQMASDSSPTSGGVFGINPTDFSMTSGTNYQFYIVVDLKGTVAEQNTIDAKIAKNKLDFKSGTWPGTSGVNTWDPAGSTQIDNTAPVITASRDTPANSNGWNNANVNSSYSASDAISGLANPATGTYTFTSEGAGQSHTFTVTDLAGNSAQGSVTGVNIDNTAPVITITAPTNSSNAASQTLTYSVTDNLDPDPDVSGPINGGIYTISGAYSILISAEDLAGNLTSGAVAFMVSNPNDVINQNSNSLYNRPENLTSEVINDYRSVRFEPVGYVYFYHPLTEVDMAAFDSMVVDENAYRFINGSLELIGHDGLRTHFEETDKKNRPWA